MDRRDFIGLAAGALAGGGGNANADDVAPAAPAGADALLAQVRERFGGQYTDEQYAAIRREIDGNLRNGRRLHESALANGDEPVLAPSSIYRNWPTP